jgi:hypothetical protein
MANLTAVNHQPDATTLTPLVHRSEAFFRALLWLLAV